MSSGGSKSQVIGYWYKYLQALVLCKGPVDAILEFRAGGRTAWKGVITETSQVYVNARNLWGGQKKEGGVQGFLDLQLGDADQEPNDYLAAKLGSAQPSYRGLALAVWRGGLWGAMNPYPKRSAWKVRRILADWDNNEPWYPEKAEIQLAYANFDYDQAGWKYKIEPPGSDADYSSPSYDDSGWDTGPGGFGSASYGEFTVGTYVSSGTAGKGIWIRRTFDAVAGLPLNIRVAHDDGAWLWVNGQAVSISPTEDYFLGTATVPGPLVYSRNVIALKVLDSIPAGTPTEIFAALALDQGEHELLAMNPAHVLYDTVTASDMQGEPTALINDASFRAAADQLYAEGLGICTYYDYEETIEDFQERILRIIGGALTFSREHGEYYLDLIRPTADPDSLTTITSDDIISITVEPTTITEQVNEVIVEWFDVENCKKRSTPPMQSRGAVHAAGRPIPETIKYPEIAIESLAMRLAARDLAAMSTPLSKVTLTTNRRGDIWKLRPGLKARIQAPEEGVTDMTIVVGDIEYGTLKDGKIKITGVQDVYSMPEATYVTVQPSQAAPVYQPPVAPPFQRLIEAPYVEVVANLSAAELAYFPDDSGAIMAMAVEPSSGLNYSLYSAPAGVELDETGSGEWCPSALIVEAAGYLDASFTMTAASGLELVEVGSWALWDDEIVRVDAIDEDALTVTLGRGCADTVPWQHAAGSRIWFCGDWAATDGAQYLDGDTVNAKLLTRTSIDELALESAALLAVEMDQRWFRPYPPAGLLINGESYPEEPSGDLTVEWSGRDRVMQSDQLIDASVASIGPEAGTTYDLEIWDRDGEVLYHSEAGVTSPANVLNADVPFLARLEVWAVRDGLRSWQAAQAEFTHGIELWTVQHLSVPAKIILDDQSAVTEVSGAASVWADRSGNGWHVTAPSAGARPVITTMIDGARRALQFDGNSDRLMFPSGARGIFQNTGAGWIFVIERSAVTDATDVEHPVVAFTTASPTTRFAIFHGTTISGHKNRLVTGGRRLDSNGWQNAPVSAESSNEWNVALGVADWANGKARQYLNGELVGENPSFQTAGNTSNTASEVASIGAYPSNTPSTFFNGQIAAVVIGSGSLPSASEIDKLFGYYMWHFGLEANLPVGHPYKLAPPTVE